MKAKKKINVIFFLPVFKWGGATESIIKLTKFLIIKNFSISIISIGKNYHKKYLKGIGCNVYEINSSRAIFSILKLRSLIKSELNKKIAKTILISNIHYANILALVSCFRLQNIKIILTERSSIAELLIYNNFLGYIKNRIIFNLIKFYYRFANLIITNSKFEKNFIKKKFKFKNIISIYPPSISKVNKKNRINIKYSSTKKIIYVGRLSKEKGVLTILKALSKIKKEINFLFKIYGDGEEKNKLEQFVKINNLKEKVLFMGYSKNKNKIFSNADLFINSSEFEGLPNAMVQSINNNIFPICSKSPGGNYEVIKYGKLGMSFKTNDYLDLKKKIILFFKKKIYLNQKTRVAYMRNFTLKKSNNSYLKILKKI